MDKPVYVVLEEDGTEVDEEEYFQTLPGEAPRLNILEGASNLVRTKRAQKPHVSKVKINLGLALSIAHTRFR